MIEMDQMVQSKSTYFFLRVVQFKNKTMKAFFCVLLLFLLGYGFANVCGPLHCPSNDLCCDESFGIFRCYSPTTHSCLPILGVTDRVQNVLCGINDRGCL